MKKFISILLMLICLATSGCSLLDNEIANKKSSRENCTLNEKNAALFSYGGTEYLILENTVDKNALGEWVGYIQKLAILDNQYTVLELREIALSELAASNLPDEAMYLVSFLNIYADDALNSQNLIVNVNDAFHVAVPKEQADNTMQTIAFAELRSDWDGEIVINPKNCTQIMYMGKMYQITETIINENELDIYLGVIGTHITFDANTNQEIPQSELKKIEITPGKLSQQERNTWNLGLVYSIAHTESNRSIAVQINDQYIQADVLQ